MDSIDTNWSNESLKTLYKISCTINAARTRQELLADFIDVFSKSIGVRSSLVRLLTDDGWMEAVSSYGISKTQLRKHIKTPIDGSMFSRSSDVIGESHEAFLREIVKREPVTVYAVPVRYQVRTHGLINLYSDSARQVSRETRRLWLAAGKHLGHALDKYIEETEQKQQLIQNERNIIANELHD